MAIDLYILSDNGLYLYHISPKYLKGFRVIERTRISYLKFQRGIIPWKCWWGCGTSSLHSVWWRFIIVACFMKIAQRVFRAIDTKLWRTDRWTNWRTNGQGYYYRASVDFVRRGSNQAGASIGVICSLANDITFMQRVSKNSEFHSYVCSSCPSANSVKAVV